MLARNGFVAAPLGPGTERPPAGGEVEFTGDVLRAKGFVPPVGASPTRGGDCGAKGVVFADGVWEIEALRANGLVDFSVGDVAKLPKDEALAPVIIMDARKGFVS